MALGGKCGIAVLAGVLAACFAGSALAQAYPSKPIRMVLALGGGGETLARFIGQKIPREKLEGFDYRYTALFEAASVGAYIGREPALVDRCHREPPRSITQCDWCSHYGGQCEQRQHF